MTSTEGEKSEDGGGAVKPRQGGRLISDMVLSVVSNQSQLYTDTYTIYYNSFPTAFAVFCTTLL